MHLIVCIDDRDGMSFGGRRLSSDRSVTEYIQNLAADSKLWMSAYSAALFSETPVCVDTDFLQKAGAGEFCFVETTPMENLADLESVTLIRWNRKYPFTQAFPREILSPMQLVYTEDFPGNSHDKITVERYIP